MDEVSGARDDDLAQLPKAAAAGDPRAMRRLSRKPRGGNPWEAERWNLRAEAAEEKIPPAVAAAAGGLGAYQLTFSRRNLGVVVKIGFLLVALALLGAAVGAVVQERSWLNLGRLPLALWITGMAAYWCSPSRRVWVFERGLAHGRRNRPAALRWAEATVLRTITRRVRDGRYQPVSCQYTVRNPDGAELTFNQRRFGRMRTWLLAETIERAVTAVHLPDALASLASGGRQRFGDLMVTRDGITGERGTVGWHELEDLDTSEGMVQIKRADTWLPWSTTKAAEIPNVFLLNAITESTTTQTPTR